MVFSHCGLLPMLQLRAIQREKEGQGFGRSDTGGKASRRIDREREEIYVNIEFDSRQICKNFARKGATKVRFQKAVGCDAGVANSLELRKEEVRSGEAIR